MFLDTLLDTIKEYKNLDLFFLILTIIFNIGFSFFFIFTTNKDRKMAVKSVADNYRKVLERMLQYENDIDVLQKEIYELKKSQRD